MLLWGPSYPASPDFLTAAWVVQDASSMPEVRDEHASQHGVRAVSVCATETALSWVATLISEMIQV